MKHFKRSIAIVSSGLLALLGIFITIVPATGQAQSASLTLQHLTVGGRIDVRGFIHKTGGPVVIQDTLRVEGSISRAAGPVIINDTLNVTGGNFNVGSLFTVNKSTGKITTASIDATSIVDTTRAVNIPLTSFYDCQTDLGADLNFTSGAEDIADFYNDATDGKGIALRFDATSGSEDQNSEVCSNFMVPPDYASGGTIRIRARKDFHSGATENITCGVSVNGNNVDTPGTVTTTDLVSTLYNCTPQATLAANDSANLYISIASDATMNDPVDVKGMEFVYTATQ